MGDTNKLRLALVTTARSDYSTMYPLMKAASQDARFEARILCGGMHWLPRFGETYRQLEQDGLAIAERVDFLDDRDDDASLGRSLGKAVTSFSEALIRQRPAYVVVSGDRIEVLSLALAATSLRIPLAHLCGGDVTEGAFDNQVRHALTKLSHLHFVSMPEHAARVRRMGEEAWRVAVTGDAALDTLRGFKPASREELESAVGIPRQGPLILATFHPQTLGGDDFAAQFGMLLDVLSGLRSILVLTYPNTDPGYQSLVGRLEDFRRRRPDAILVRSFTRSLYYSVMAHAQLMIGNSSSGLWEAPSFGLPVVNVGSRQAGRLRASNVIDVSGNDRAELEAALGRASDPMFRSSLTGLRNPYGDGRASPAILDFLASTPVDDRLMIKKFDEGGA